MSRLLSLSPIIHTLLLIFCIMIDHVTAQSVSSSGTNFTCSVDSTPSCKTHVSYFAQSPDFLDVGNISNLFAVSRLSVSKASNLNSEDSELFPGQLLLVPITCACNGTYYFANMTYEIKKGDSYYLVSINAFENLTNWHVVEDMNPTLHPTLLQIGTKVIFPLFCKCPSTKHLGAGVNYLITYIWQPDDDVLSVSNKFNSTPRDIIKENNQNNFSSVVGHPVLIPVAHLPILDQRYAICPERQKSNSKRWWTIAGVIMSAGSLFVLLSACSLVYAYRRPKKGKSLDRKGSTLETDDLIQMKYLKKSDSFEHKRIHDKLLPGVSGYLSKPIMYDVRAIMEATMNLSEHFRIGGSVYRAIITGQILAVKRIKTESTEEIKILQRVSHANLVKLMGISSDVEGNCFLAFEYAQNGSLNKWLHQDSSSSSGSAILTWRQRLHIALDVANGLQYMHEHTQPSIALGNIRTGNILLDSRFKAKISNFSLARSASSSTELKADIFAFGVVLLELLSGKKATGIKENGEIGMLWKDVKEILEIEDTAMKQERLRRWIDPNMEGYYPLDGVLSLALLAKACTKEMSSARPSMTEIVFNLSVLTHAPSDSLDKSWNSTEETEKAVQIVCPISAR